MAELDQIIQISITRETTAVSTTAFNIPLALAEFDDADFTTRTRTYSSANEVATDLGANSVAYVMAQRLFGQDVKPATIIIGRKEADESWTEALEAVEDENNDWYEVSISSHEDADILEVAAAVEAREKVFFAGTGAAAVADVPYTVGATDIGSQLFDRNYTRTALVYSPTIDVDFTEVAWVGDQLQYTPGSNDWDFKSLSGPTVTALSSTQVANLRAKSVNFYRRVAGVEIMQDGNMVSGEPIDIVILADWIKARMQEGIFNRMVNLLKIPYTRAGFAIIESEMRTALTEGQDNGGIDTFSINIPDPLSIPLNQRAGRVASGITFTARLTGSVRRVIIQGNLTV